MTGMLTLFEHICNISKNEHGFLAMPNDCKYWFSANPPHIPVISCCTKSENRLLLQLIRIVTKTGPGLSKSKYSIISKITSKSLRLIV
ncbi:hypothetical protein V1477_000167 [Vespula maculifrons]|uniref:Uncharacterized protein n=1 Tax=Vespula maculifrons TaxID=7453 RepID=A0ABD2D3N1_VESMC